MYVRSVGKLTKALVVEIHVRSIGMLNGALVRLEIISCDVLPVECVQYAE